MNDPASPAPSPRRPLTTQNDSLSASGRGRGDSPPARWLARRARPAHLTSRWPRDEWACSDSANAFFGLPTLWVGTDLAL